MSDAVVSLRDARGRMKIEAQSSDPELAQRQDLVKRIDTLQGQLERGSPPLLRARAAATAKREAAEKDFRAALAEEGAAIEAAGQLDRSINYEIAGLQRQLREGASALIDQAISGWWRMIDRDRDHRCPALLAAINAATELKLQALSTAELELRIRALQASIPIQQP